MEQTPLKRKVNATDKITVALIELLKIATQERDLQMVEFIQETSDRMNPILATLMKEIEEYEKEIKPSKDNLFDELSEICKPNHNSNMHPIFAEALKPFGIR